MVRTYDVIVIGAGGGAKIISPAARLGLKVACIEKDRLGGTCLNRGCIPSKMLIHPADVAMNIKEASRYDIHNEPAFTVNFAGLVNRISATVDNDSNRIEAGYARNSNIDYYHGTARFVSDKVIEVNGERLTAGKIFISVGVRPRIPDIEGLAGTPFMTSTEALRNTRLPKDMVIIGGGYIAVELGHAYAALGTRTTFLVRRTFLRHEDEETAAEFTRAFSKYHTVHLHTHPVRVAHHDGTFTISCRNDAGEEFDVRADALLVAAGVVSNTDTLALENTGVVCDDQGYIRVDDRLRTGVEGVYALGDCLGRYMFRHTVNFEGEYLFRTVFKNPVDEAIRYPPIPHAIFSHPQIAGVGATEQELKEQGVDYVAGVNPYKSSAMGMALLSDHGFVKILVERSTAKLLGAHIVGPEASDMIHMLIAFMTMDATLDDLLRMIYVHPALPEVVRNAARKARAALVTPAPAG